MSMSSGSIGWPSFSRISSVNGSAGSPIYDRSTSDNLYRVVCHIGQGLTLLKPHTEHNTKLVQLITLYQSHDWNSYLVSSEELVTVNASCCCCSSDNTSSICLTSFSSDLSFLAKTSPGKSPIIPLLSSSGYSPCRGFRRRLPLERVKKYNSMSSVLTHLFYAPTIMRFLGTSFVTGTFLAIPCHVLCKFFARAESFSAEVILNTMQSAHYQPG